MKKNLARNKIWLGLILALLLTGCGLKSNPVPLTAAVEMVLTDQKLTAEAQGNAVVLIWQLQDKSGTVQYVKIEKSYLGTEEKVCRDCPRTYKELGQIGVLDPGKKDYRFADVQVEKGKIYSYRLKLCNEAGVCRESKAVEIDFK